MVLAAPDVMNGVAIRDNVAVEAPTLAQDVGEEEGIRAGGNAVNRVIGAHDSSDVSFANSHLKLWEVSFVRIPFGRSRVEAMPFGFRPAVNGVMFGAGHR